RTTRRSRGGACITRPRPEPPWRRPRTEATRSRTGRPTRSWPAGPTIPARPGPPDRQRAGVEDLAVEFLDGFLGLATLEELDKGEPPGSARVAIDGQYHVRRRGDGPEIRPEVRFSWAAGGGSSGRGT